MKKVLALSVVAVLMLALLTSCFGGREIDEELVGTWFVYGVPIFVFEANGTGTTLTEDGEKEVEWWVNGDTLNLRIVEGGERQASTYVLEDGVLTLTDDDGVTMDFTQNESEFDIPNLDDLETPGFGIGGNGEDDNYDNGYDDDDMPGIQPR